MFVFDRHVPPAKERLSLLGDDARQKLLESQPGAGFCGEEHRARAVAALGWQLDTRSGRDLAQEAIRDLDQNAGAVAGIGFTPARAAVLQVDQYLQAARDYRMGSPACNIDDEPDAAGVVFEGWIVESASLQ